MAISGRIPKHFINDLLARVDIVDLIDIHVPLKKSGANHTARCPFHSEKTPSFSVNRNKQFFHCFGCGASGNAIGFLMDFNHLDFVEAVEDLATFAGVEVPREHVDFQNTSTDKAPADYQYQLLDRVAQYFEQQLRKSEAGKKAVTYLKARGINDQLAKDFMIGYSPNEWQALANQFDQQQLIQTGMAISKDGKTYDRFRGRIMYPIRDKRGRVVGFGGRVLDDSLPKYLNSPETDIFHKGKEVYGLYELLRKDSKPKKILIVEGYMDVIALAAHGIPNAVATLGTATSQAHLDLLFRFSSELVFCFDGDNAGQNAAWKAMDPAFSALKDGRQVRIMLLPPQHDPDSLVHEEGVVQFERRIQNSLPLSDYFFNALTANLNLNEMEAKSQLFNKAKPYLEKLPESTFRDLMFAKLNTLANVDILKDRQKSTRLPKKPRVGSNQDNRVLPLPRRVLALLVQNPGLIGIIETDIVWTELEFPGLTLFKAIFTDIAEKKPTNTAVLLEAYRNLPNEKTVKALATLNLFPHDQNVDISWIENEFRNGFENLLVQAKKEAFFRKLVAKE